MFGFLPSVNFAQSKNQTFTSLTYFKYFCNYINTPRSVCDAFVTRVQSASFVQCIGAMPISAPSETAPIFREAQCGPVAKKIAPNSANAKSIGVHDFIIASANIQKSEHADFITASIYFCPDHFQINFDLLLCSLRCF